MFTSIRTSLANRQRVSDLTRRFGFRTENIVARIAFVHSLAQGRIDGDAAGRDGKGKEYSTQVLFGDYLPVYVALVCSLYDIPRNHRDMPKYVKLHLDDGLERLDGLLAANPNDQPWELFMQLVQDGLTDLTATQDAQQG
jgi:DNA sulfur modification protein DndE